MITFPPAGSYKPEGAPAPTTPLGRGVWSDTLVLVYHRGAVSGQPALWLPKPHVATDPSYTVLMNETTSTMTMTSTLPAVQPMGEWFTALSADVQGDITEMVNENGYPLEDIRDFIETHGAKAYADGHYATWCQLEEQIGASTEAIEAFVEEFGIHCLDGFEDAYRGEYGSEAEFAEQYTDDYYMMGHMPSWLVIDWQATWDTELSSSFTYNNGHVFISNW